jgi:hypothetical protein
MAATYEQLVDFFVKNAPHAGELEPYSPDFNDYYNFFWGRVAERQGVPTFEDVSIESIVPEDLASPNEPDQTTPTTQPVEQPPAGVLDPTGQPIEQAVLQQITPGLLNQIVGDTGRQTQVGQLTDQTNAAYGNLGALLSQSQQGFDGQAYFRTYPDVASVYQNAPDGATPGTKNIDGQDMTPSQFAQYHYQQFGREEGRNPSYSSDLLRSQNVNADQTTAAIGAAAQTAATAQLGALSTAIGQMQQNLQGSLAAQADALRQAVESYNANLTTLDASQRQNLAAQITAMQANLEKSVAEQGAALETEIASLQGNASAAAATRKAALEVQLTELRAAQAPMAEARVRGAEALSTAVNLGLQSTQDQLRAQAARDGFIGGSTMQDTALARAAIDARQQAAMALGQANIANAGDVRDIETSGARGRFSIEDMLAGDTQRIGDQGAVGRRQLATSAAQGRQQLGDYDATQTRGIGDSTATGRANIGNFATGSTLSNTNAGIAANLGLQNTQAQGGYNIATALAQQQQAAANQNAAMRSGYFDQAYPNALNSAQIQAGLPAAQAQSLASLIPYGNAGTTNALGVLNWWANPNTAAPTQTATTVAPSNSGNQLGQLGAGLVGAGFQYLNNRPQQPSNGQQLTYDQYLALNPNSSAAGGGGTPLYQPVQTDWSAWPSG